MKKQTNKAVSEVASIEKTKEERIAETVERLKDKLSLPEVKLSICAGLHFMKPENEWINHDGIANEHIDIVSEYADIPLPDACVDYLELGDCCEHALQYRVDEIWTEWTRLLKVGAKVRVGTPNFHSAMTVYAMHTLFGETLPSGWIKINAIDASGKEHHRDYHIMAVEDGITPLEAARRKIYAWGSSMYESHFITYTVATLTELMTRHGFINLDFSDSPPQEFNDPHNSWWLVCHATYGGKPVRQ